MSGFAICPSFRAAFAAVAQHYKRILIEEAVKGVVYRFFCIAGRVIAIRARIPANAKGDGSHSTAELIDIKNAVRQRPPSPLLRLGERDRELLKKSGLHADHVPEDGEIHMVRRHIEPA